MKYRLYILLLVGFSMMLGCSGNKQNQEGISDQKGVYLKGTVGFPSKDGIITIEEIKGTYSINLDTIELSENYTFNHFLPISIAGFYRLNFYGKQFVVLVVDDEDININVDGNSRKGFVEISGSSDYELIENIQTIKQSMQQSEEFQELNKKFSEANLSKNMEMMDQLRDEYKQLEKKNSDLIAEVFENSTPSIVSIELLKGEDLLDKDKYFSTFEIVSEKLVEEYGMSHPRVAEFSAAVKEMKKLSIGQVAPNLELPNPDGDLISLSSFKGKYVLVDFWAKWCKPCRLENPNVVRVYNKYNKDGFEVLGVSLDRNKEDWLQAIKEDNLTWTHISDLKFWQSEAAKIYNIKAIPFALLLDKDGKIIAKNLRGQELDKKLEEIFGH
ncbi:MAG: redoxin domain-containing protein [Cyclobacteriaceae bacterium]|nr:redoxin domain-containing protein [Cyclobacteriaceae bacterium]